MRVLFWGTSSFAVPSLEALIGEGFEVAAVVTQPDRPQGRSRSTLVPSPVKEVAVADGIPVLQPERPRGEEFLAELRATESDISVVASYGHILRPEVIDLPRLGTINVHASLLPALRGAAPIQAALREGLLETGVTIMRMVPALDAGPIILQTTTPVLVDESYGELEPRLSELGALALIEAMTLIGFGEATETPQDESRATYARKIEREDARVRWTDGAAEVARQVRAYDPRPGAFTTLGGTEVKLFGARARVERDEPLDEAVRAPAREAAPGTVLGVERRGLIVACGNGAVTISEVQPAGRTRVRAEEWERGRGVHVGDRFGD